MNQKGFTLIELMIWLLSIFGPCAFGAFYL